MPSPPVLPPPDPQGLKILDLLVQDLHRTWTAGRLPRALDGVPFGASAMEDRILSLLKCSEFPVSLARDLSPENPASSVDRDVWFSIQHRRSTP